MLDCGSEFVVSGITMAFATEISSVTRIKAELSQIESLKSDLFQGKCMIQEQLAALETPRRSTAAESEASWLISENKKKSSRNEQK